MPTIIPFAFALLLVLCSAAAEPLFPSVSELDPALVMPQDSERVEIGADGTFRVDGRPRYLLGTILYHPPSLAECAPGPGYAPENAWIYETIPDRDYLQRLGFDTVGGEVSTTWMQEFRPERKFYQSHRTNDWSLASRYWKSGLPTVVDFTCAGWSHGGIKVEEGRAPSRAAIPKGGAGHFMPYSLVTPEGRDLYARMWRSGAEELRDHDVHPYAYELFNEPTYDDLSPEARAAFARVLSKRFGGDPAAMDAAWGSSYGSFEAASSFKHPNEFAGLGVEWLKFRERVFASGIRLGLETIRAVDPEARVCFQPLGISFGFVNILAANRDCGVVMSPTGGRDSFDMMQLRAIADGKPIIDGETYLGHTRASHRARILTQWSRGFNASYYFKWERRLWDPMLKKPDGAARLAETFPWLALQPACTPTEALAGLMDAKRDIVAMDDLFGPRDHGIPAAARAAVLVSQPTERLGTVAGHGNHTFSRACALALERGAHLVADAVFEEQLAEGRLDRYRFLVAAGIDATSPGTLPALRRWVEDGGTLVLAQEAMDIDEYGRPRPATGTDFPGIALGAPVAGEAKRFDFGGVTYESVPYRETTFAESAGWSVLATLPGGHPALARRQVGKGSVWYIGVRFPARGDEGRLLAALAADSGLRPVCETLDFDTQSPVDDVEVQVARGADGDAGYVVINHGLTARAVLFRAEGSGDGAPAVARQEFNATVAEKKPMLHDITRRVCLGSNAEGFVLLLLEPDVPVVLRSRRCTGTCGTSVGHPCDPCETIAPKAGAAASVASVSSVRDSDAAAPCPCEPFDDVAARAPAWLAERRPKDIAKAFSVDPGRVRFLDLREVANRSYVDRVAGDGEGGWTDQGENHLRNAPWGPTDCNGVPFDFIRPDQNDERACVILRSTRQPYLPEAVRGIAANLRAEALYFLHAAAWLEKGKEAFRYVVHYADGTSAVVPIESSEDVGDWWIDGRRAGSRPLTRCQPGWKNSEGRGFHVLRWQNPHPKKTIATIDIESACTGTIPIIEAITAELPDESPFAAWRLKISPWGGVEAHRAQGGVELSVSDATKDWAGAGLRAVEPLPLPSANPDTQDLVFEVNGGRTPLGAAGPGGQTVQISATFATIDGAEQAGPYIHPEVDGGAVDADPWTWQTARIPLRRLLPKGANATALLRLNVQFCVLPTIRSGLLVRGIRIERGEVAADAP